MAAVSYAGSACFKSGRLSDSLKRTRRMPFFLPDTIVSLSINKTALINFT